MSRPLPRRIRSSNLGLPEGVAIAGWAPQIGLGILVATCSALLAGSAGAQSAPIGVEVVAGTSRPIRGFDGLGFSSGASAAAHVVVELAPRLSGYGGYRWTDFDCPETPCGPLAADGALQERGWVTGLQLDLPARQGIAPRLRLGATLNRLVREGRGAPAAIGVEVEGGVRVRIGTRVDLVPTLGYRRWDSDAPGEATDLPTRVPVSHLQLGVGLTLRPTGVRPP